MKLFELYQQNTLQGTNNLKQISEAVTNKTGAVITVGNTQVKLGINSARYVLGLYETAVANGTSEQFLEGLANLNPTMVMENDNTMRHIVSKFKHEVKNFLAGQELSDDLYHALFDYYSDHGEMPYGVQKARDGDPYEWVHMRFDRDVHDYAGGGNPDIPALPTATMPSMPRQESMYEASTINGRVRDPKELVWKQTSMSYEEAVEKYGKDKVRKEGKNRIGNEVIAVHVPLGESSMYESKKTKMKEGWDEMMAGVKASAEQEKGATGKFSRSKNPDSGGTVYSRKYNSDTGQTIEPTKDPEGKSPVKRSVGRPNAGVTGSDEAGTKFGDYSSWYHKSKRTHGDRKIVGGRTGAMAVTEKGKKYLVVGKWENDEGVMFDKPSELVTLDALKSYKSGKGRPKKVREWIETLRFVSEGVAGPKNCWPGHRKVGTQPGTGKNAGKRVNDCEKIGEDLDADQKRVGQVGGEERAKKIGTVLGTSPKQHPFKGRLVGEDLEKNSK